MDRRVVLAILAVLCLRFSKFVMAVVLIMASMVLTQQQSREPRRVNCAPIAKHSSDSAVRHSLKTSDRVDNSFRGLSHEIVEKYIRSWFVKVSVDPAFPNALETSIEAAFAKLVERGKLIDWQHFLSCKCLPVIVRHFNDYVRASEKMLSVKKHSKSKNQGPSRLISIYEYLHPGLASTTKVDALAFEIAEMLIEKELLDYPPVKHILVDIVRNLVIENVLSTFGDADYINQQIIIFAEGQMADAEKVTRMRRVLQQSLSASHLLPRVSSDSHPADYEKFMQQINTIPTKDVAKQLEKSLDSQLKVLEGAAYKPANVLLRRRLEESRKALEKRMKELSPSPPPEHTDSTVQDVVEDPPFSAAFAQFMAGQHDQRYQLLLDIIDVHKTVASRTLGDNGHIPLTREDLIHVKGVCRRVLLASFKMNQTSRRIISRFVESDHVTTDLFMNTEKALWSVKVDLVKDLEPALDRFKMSPNYAKYLEKHISHTQVEEMANVSSLIDGVDRESISESLQELLDGDPALESILTEDSEEDTLSDEDIHPEASEPAKVSYEERLRQILVEIEQIERHNTLVSSLLAKAELNGDATEIRVFKQSKETLERELQRKTALKARFLERLRDHELYGKIELSVDRWAHFNDGAGEYTSYLVDIRSTDDAAGGWVMPRRFSQFSELRKILKKEFPEVSDMEFPARRMVLKFQQRHFVEARKVLLNHFLQDISKSEAICNHLAFRMFLSSQNFPDSYYEVSQASAVLNGGSLPKGHEYQTAVDSVCGAFLTLFNVDQKTDWIKGKAIVTIVHQVLGSTIEKRINEAIENMVLKIPEVVDSLATRISKDQPVKEQRSYADKAKTREYADALCYRLIRHYFAPVIGPSRTLYCKTVLMQILQNPVLNRHLILALMSLLVQELFPDPAASDPVT